MIEAIRNNLAGETPAALPQVPVFRARGLTKVYGMGTAEVRALAVTGITHAAYLGLPDPERGQRAVLCVETPSGRLSAADRECLLAALAPMPVDTLHAFRRIPRDPRHASKTDTETLRRLLKG